MSDQDEEDVHHNDDDEEYIVLGTNVSTGTEDEQAEEEEDITEVHEAIAQGDTVLLTLDTILDNDNGIANMHLNTNTNVLEKIWICIDDDLSDNEKCMMGEDNNRLKTKECKVQVNKLHFTVRSPTGQQSSKKISTSSSNANIKSHGITWYHVY